MEGTVLPCLSEIPDIFLWVCGLRMPSFQYLLSMWYVLHQLMFLLVALEPHELYSLGSCSYINGSGLGTQFFVKRDIHKLKGRAKDTPAPNIDLLSDEIRRTKRSGGSKKRPVDYFRLKPTTLSLPNSRNLYTFHPSSKKHSWAYISCTQKISSYEFDKL